MEYQFENRYYCSQHRLAEFFRKFTVGPHPAVVVLCVVLICFSVVQSLRYGFIMDMLPMLLVMSGIFTLMYFMPDWLAWISLRNGKKQNDGILPETIITFGDMIELHEGMVHYTIEYRKIVRVVHLKHSYALMIGKRNGLLLDPDNFAKGTFEEFKQFLREKRPDLVIPE